MKEPLSNIGIASNESFDKRKANWQKLNKAVVINKGDYVQLAFKEGEAREHMWVKVESVTKQGKFRGVLDNDPVLIKNIKDGDKVVFSRDEIEGYMKGDGS